MSEFEPRSISVSKAKMPNSCYSGYRYVDISLMDIDRGRWVPQRKDHILTYYGSYYVGKTDKCHAAVKLSEIAEKFPDIPVYYSSSGASQQLESLCVA